VSIDLIQRSGEGVPQHIDWDQNGVNQSRTVNTIVKKDKQWSTMLPVSLDCTLLVAPSVFSNVYLSVSLDCTLLVSPSVFSNVYLSVSLDCTLLVSPSVFSNVYLSVSLDCTLLVAPSVFSNVYLSVSLDCTLLVVPSVFSNVYYLQSTKQKSKDWTTQTPQQTGCERGY
jgi:hypothetical protein